MSVEVCPDARALRLGRRQRALEQMAAHDLDVLVVGRQANVRYIAGAPQLWVAGTRPFGPTCVLVRATGAVHLLSTWDEGVPDDTVYAVTRTLWTSTSDLVAAHPAAKGMDAAKALAGIVIPLHPGAERYYRQTGLLK